MPRNGTSGMSNKGRTSGPRERGRWSSKRKMECVLRLLRGEDLDTVSREVGVTAARLSEWREEFLAAGQQSLKSRKDAAGPGDEELQRLRAKLGEVMMENELLWKRADAAEEKNPFPWRRSKR